MKFDAETRGRFVGLVEAGDSLADAAGRVGVSERTIHTWLARGRKEQGTAHAEFAQRVDALLAGEAGGLSDDDLVGLLERQARKGSVRAIQLLLERPWEKKRASDGDTKKEPVRDPLAEFDELAAHRRGRRAA